jgi:membrane protease YdiL (CAAX protease family)
LTSFRSAQQTDEAHPAKGVAVRARRPPVLVLLGVLVLAWFLLIQRFGAGNVYAVMGPYACAVSLLLIGLRPRLVAGWLAPHARPIAIGLALGVAMTLLTYPAFQLVAAAFPGFDSHVQSLYGGARTTTLPKALAWVVCVVFAEELLFRGVLPDALSRHVSERAALAISLVVYTLAQAGTGSLIVMLIAVVCGGIWSVERKLTNSLLAPLISHLIWTPTVILLYPVT